MNQLRQFFKGLSVKQRITLALTAVFVLGGIYLFTHWSHEQDFKPLYSSLSPEDASAIILKLKEGGIEYRIGESGSTILVPSKHVPELRLQMASLGIPKSGRIGYELFDRTNLSLTDFSEQVNYHRAIEGELERSVMSMNEVEQARVHITFPKDSVFTESRQPAKASVMVKLKPGSKLSTQNAQAVTQLVSSAVEGLTPEAVSVMDMQGNLLIRPKKPGDGSEPSEELLAWKQQLEAQTLAKINSVLDPLLGSEKYRASVDIDCDQTSGEQSEETFDPTHSVVTTSQRTEEGSISRDTAGIPGTQSNLPRPVPRPAAVGGGLARRSESMSYETSRLVKKLRLPEGIVRRMSVSVLLDQRVKWEPAKAKGAYPTKTIEALSGQEVKVIHDVVSAAAGVNVARGDQLTVDSLPFEATLQAQPPDSMMPAAPLGNNPAPRFWKRPAVLLGMAMTLILCLGIGFLVANSRQKSRVAIHALERQLEAAQRARAAELSPELAAAEDSVALSPTASEAPKSISESREVFDLPPIGTTKAEMLTKYVTEEAHKDPAALAQIIRSWLNEVQA
jgi:flagellar M-ring protein FliF